MNHRNINDLLCAVETKNPAPRNNQGTGLNKQKSCGTTQIDTNVSAYSRTHDTRLPW